MKIKLFILWLSLLACTLTNAPMAESSLEPYQLAKRPQIVKADEITCIVTAAQSLNVRQSPATLSAVIAVLKHGEVVTILADDVQSVWVEIKTQNITGYINSNYCERN